MKLPQSKPRLNLTKALPTNLQQPKTVLQKKAEILASFKAMGDLPLPFPTLFISEMLADALFPLVYNRQICTYILPIFFCVCGDCFLTLLFEMGLGGTKRCFVSGFMYLCIYFEVSSI